MNTWPEEEVFVYFILQMGGSSPFINPLALEDHHDDEEATCIGMYDDARMDPAPALKRA